MSKNLFNWKFKKMDTFYMLHKSEQEIRVVLYKGFFSNFQGLEKMEFSNTQSCEKPSDFDKKK